MATSSTDQFTVSAKANIEKLTIVAKTNAEALTKSGNAAISGLESLTKAYQDLATRNVEKLAAGIKTLASVKSPVEFFEVQQKLVKEGFESALADSRAIAELTTSVFTAAFEPVQKQVAAFQDIAKKAA
ncbi:phasin family protein [Magnetospirillum sp. SS-4]|uniref:phasin family protein n=1 Tax=Magnetospirillum sp. SS-4 TaxID=2681465 RepID=UPI001383778F|nr:phasin family protein [Magnetospirillum sp. SS-4]CAA7627587.1 putative phasin [Magnetospirillum sp. SS-4]